MKSAKPAALPRRRRASATRMPTDTRPNDETAVANPGPKGRVLTQEGSLERVEPSPGPPVPGDHGSSLRESPAGPTGVALSSAIDAAKYLAEASRSQTTTEIAQTLQYATGDRQIVAGDAAASRLFSIGARDAIEEMMAVQMLALHSAAVECARRAALPAQSPEIRRDNIMLAGKSGRAFAALADSFDRRRRGGEQKMTVEHVHVHPGAQAIIGNVSRGKPGTRKNQKGQSDAT